MVFVVIEENSSLQDTIFCFGISLLPKLLFLMKVVSYTRPLTVWRCNFRILSVHREPKCLGYRHNHSNAPFCFDHIGVSWFFWPEGLLRHWWSEFLKYNLLFAFEYSFRYDKCYYLFFFSFAFSFFNARFLC